jgi:CDP-alcohol phosphatidyltransferase
MSRSRARLEGSQSPAVAPSGVAEEWIDQRLHRPLAAILVRPVAATSITPNQVTAVAGAAGVAAGILVFFAVESPAMRLAAAALLFTAVILDCVDGQLARVRGTASRTGDMFDGLADLAVNLAVLSGITYTLVRQSGEQMTWWLGLAAMVSYGVQCSLFDFAKRTYLSRIGARPLPTAEDWAQIERERQKARRDGRGGESFLLWFFSQYVGTLRVVAAALPGFAPSALTVQRMRVWTALGLGSHLAMLYLALAVSAFWSQALMLALVAFLTVGNVLLVALLR